MCHSTHEHCYLNVCQPNKQGVAYAGLCVLIVRDIALGAGPTMPSRRL